MRYLFIRCLIQCFHKPLKIMASLHVLNQPVPMCYFIVRGTCRMRCKASLNLRLLRAHIGVEKVTSPWLCRAVVLKKNKQSVTSCPPEYAKTSLPPTMHSCCSWPEGQGMGTLWKCSSPRFLGIKKMLGRPVCADASQIHFLYTDIWLWLDLCISKGKFKHLQNSWLVARVLLGTY